MAMDWQNNSELVAGLLLDNRLALNSVRPDLFFPPYDEIVVELKSGKEIEELIEAVGLSPIQAAHEAAKTLNGLGEKVNWISLLEKSKAYYDAGKKLEKLSKKLVKGEEINWSELNVLSERAQAGVGGDFTPLSQIKGCEMPFIETGWSIFDEHIGGLPAVGLITVGGQPGVGKTTFMGKVAQKFVECHKSKKVALFSIEMVRDELAMRLREIGKLSPEDEERLLINDLPVIPEEVINKAATVENIGLVIVDFADLMIRGDSSESAMAHIYRTLALGSKSLGCPVMLLAQLVKYEQGIPKPKHLRYTKMAEALSWMILMLYNPSTDWSSAEDEKEKDLLPVYKQSSYIIAWKIRGGFRKHREDSPGAILTAFDGQHGWGDKRSQWFSLRKT